MKASNFLGNMVKYCIPSVISALLSFAVLPLISRVFPTDDYGKINMYYSMGNMIQYIFLMGMDSAYIRFYFDEPEGLSRKDIFAMTFWTSIIANVLMSTVIFTALREQASVYLFGEKKYYLLILMPFYIFGLSMFRLLSIETRMEGKTLLYNIQQVLLIIINRVSYVFAAFVTTNYQFSIIVITFFTFFLGLFFLVKQKSLKEIQIPQVNVKAYKQLYAFSIPLMPTTVLTWLNNSAAKMVLSAYGDFESLGIMSIAISLANVFALIPSAFCIYWAPFMYKNYKEEQSFIQKVHNYILLLSIAIVLSFFCAQDLIYLIIGEDYRSSQSFFMLIMLLPIQSILCETTAYGIMLANKTKINLYLSIVVTAVNIVMCGILYPFMGVSGIAVGIALSAIMQLTLQTVIGQHFYSSIVNQWQTTFGYAVIILITISNLWVFNSMKDRVMITLLTSLLAGIVFRYEIVQLIAYMKHCVQTLRRKLHKSSQQ